MVLITWMGIPGIRRSAGGGRELRGGFPTHLYGGHLHLPPSVRQIAILDALVEGKPVAGSLIWGRLRLLTWASQRVAIIPRTGGKEAQP